MKVLSDGEAILAQSLVAAGAAATGAENIRVQTAMAAVARAAQPLEAMPYSIIRDVLLSGQIADEYVVKIIQSMPNEFRVWWADQSKSMIEEQHYGK